MAAVVVCMSGSGWECLQSGGGDGDYIGTGQGMIWGVRSRCTKRRRIYGSGRPVCIYRLWGAFGIETGRLQGVQSSGIPG